MSILMKHLMRPILILTVLLLVASAAFSQKVRLRSQINPACTSGAGSNLKFADIFGDGNIAVMGTYGCKGAFIFDITNPDAPVQASWYNPVIGTNTVYFLEAIVIGNRAYFGSGGGTTGGDGVHIVDVSDPYHPVFLGKVNVANGNGFNTIHEMVVFNQNGGTYLLENFNGLGTKTLKVINVTNPAAPVFVRDITPTDPQWVHAMVIKGDRLFTSGWGNNSARGRTEIYDISNIATQAPALLGFITDPSSNVTAGNNMHSSWPSEDGNYLYSCRETNDGKGDVRTYDISNPGTPLLVNRITMTDLGINAVTPHNPVVAGNYLYVSWYQAGVQIFDLTNPAAPRRVGQYDTFQPTFANPELPPDSEVVQVKRARTSRSRLVDSEPWDLICGAASLQNALPTSYDGNWAVYPFLGQDKILAGDLANGLMVLDASQIAAPLKNKAADFDGDRRTDLSVFHPASGSWQLENTGGTDNAVRIRLGSAGDQVVAGDYDGDGRADIAVFRPSTGEWFARKLRSRERANIISGQYGLPNDIPVPGDYDADGRTDVAVYRPSNMTFYIWQSTLSPQTPRIVTLGNFGDRPVVGDYDGDGKADVAVWRPTTGAWVIQQSSSSIVLNFTLGQSGDRPVSGDFDGNGVTDLAVYRPSTGEWITRDPITLTQNTSVWGTAQDVAIPSDFDGDGKADLAVYRPSTNHWIWRNSSDGSTTDRVFGQSGDLPVPLSVQPQ